MGQIIGIKVNLETSSDWWAPTSDALFLGVYSNKGGREFRINGNVSFSQPNQDFVLVLGQGCCTDGSETQVQYSQNLQVNDPLLNPIVLEDVNFVYLRKETADSTTVNDDQYKLDLASVLLCDNNGGLRRFKKQRNINFSDEGGLQHWLGEVAPPKCRVTVLLKAIYHKDEAKNPAGYNWEFDFKASVNGSTQNILNNESIKIKKKDEPDEWHRHFDEAVSFDIIGCCGQKPTVNIFGNATELDFWDPDDYGSDTASHQVTCTPEGNKIEGELNFIVDAKFKKRKSRIRYEYCIISRCIP